MSNNSCERAQVSTWEPLVTQQNKQPKNNYTEREGKTASFACNIPSPRSALPRGQSHDWERVPIAGKGRAGWATSFSTLFEHYKAAPGTGTPKEI